MKLRNKSNLVSSAGWLYADLLLVLVIVGFGVASTTKDPSALKQRISVLEQENQELKNELEKAQQRIRELENSGSESWQLNCREVGLEVNKSVSQLDLDEKVNKNIELAIENRKLNPEFTKVGLVLSYGGYDARAGLSNDSGFRDAEKLLPMLQASPRLQGAEFLSNGAQTVRINGDKQMVNDDGVYLKIYLVFKGDPALSECGLPES
jgi:hypothetical protein